MLIVQPADYIIFNVNDEHPIVDINLENTGDNAQLYKIRATNHHDLFNFNHVMGIIEPGSNLTIHMRLLVKENLPGDDTNCVDVHQSPTNDITTSAKSQWKAKGNVMTNHKRLFVRFNRE
ncbi:hypothetical protein ACQ4LE_008891 [Meloidogyne hapla]